MSKLGIWTRKKHNFLLPWKFSLLSTQEKCAGNKRNKTNRLSALFSTKNHQNPLSSLGERVVWSCIGGFKNISKTKTHTSRTHWHYCRKEAHLTNLYNHVRIMYVFSFWRRFWNHLRNFKQLFLQDYSTDFDNFWCKMKVRPCLVCFFRFQHSFVEAKATKTFKEVNRCVFSLSKFQRCR